MVSGDPTSFIEETWDSNIAYAWLWPVVPFFFYLRLIFLIPPRIFIVFSENPTQLEKSQSTTPKYTYFTVKHIPKNYPELITK